MVDTLVNLQDPHESIVTTSAINLSQEKVYHIPDWPFPPPCDTLTSASFQGFNFSELLSFDPASIGSVLLDVDDQQLQPTGIVNQLRHMKDLLSAPIDTLVQDSDEMKHLLEEIQS
jgi:hypothetical protein